ncbi:MAG: hypothetical protein CMN76_13325 [Spirochaetaceae bacterium]|nr:hypothetical protein [Spirochaetaceae bacterium]
MLLLASTLFSFCQPEPAELQKRWKAHSVQVKKGASSQFAELIKKEAYMDLSVPFNFQARLPESDGMFSHFDRLTNVSGMASIERNETIDKLEINIEYEKPEKLQGSSERFAVHNASAESITIYFGMNDESGDGGYRVTFHPAD